MKPSKKKKPLSEKQRASDEALREELRNFDLKKFDAALEKAIPIHFPVPQRLRNRDRCFNCSILVRQNPRQTQTYRRAPTESLNPIGDMSVLPQLRQSLNYLLLISGPLAPIVFRFDPIRGMWIGWVAAMLLLISHGVIPLIERVPQYLSGILLLTMLIGVIAGMYVETAAGWILCLSNQNIGGALRPSALAAPPNPCLRGRPAN